MCPTFLFWQGRPDSNRDVRIWNPPDCRLFLRPFAMHQGGLEPPCPFRDDGFTGRCLTNSASDARILFIRMIPEIFAEKIDEGGKRNALNRAASKAYAFGG